QSFAGYAKVEGIIAHYVATNREGEAHGFEAIRLINRELSIQSRAEALGFRSSLLSLVVKEERLLDAVRSVETQLHQFEVLLRSASGPRVTDGMALNEADKVLILLRNLPPTVRTYVQLHGRSSTFEELKNSVLTYDLNTRVLGDVSAQVNAFSAGNQKGEEKGKGVAQSRNDHVSPLPETTLEALRMSESTGIELLADQWLNDSGATAHIVSRRHLSSYRVLKEHPSLGCELKAANDGIIATYGIVDIEVRFLTQTSRSQGRVKSFVLTKCIIADIPFSVISPYALKGHGWVTTLGDERESKMSKGGASIKLEIRDRAWWATAQLKKGMAPTDAVPMDVSTVRAPAAVESGVAVVPTPATSAVQPDGSKAQHVNPKSILKATTSTTDEGDVQGLDAETGEVDLELEGDDLTNHISNGSDVSESKAHETVLLELRRAEAPPSTPGPAPMEMDASGDGVEDMAVEPSSDAMEVDLLIDWVTMDLSDKLLSLEQSTKGSPWFEDAVCGKTAWQQLPSEPVCESTGAALSHEQVEGAMRKEFSQRTKLEVGVPISEREARVIAQETGTKVLPTRWVVVKKHDGRVRARLVVKDLRSAGLPAVREGHYSPTSSLESLRLLLAISARLGLSLVTIDISTAFLYASLCGERQVVKLPSSCKDEQGNPIFLDLLKALYGLRRAPVYWYKELKRALLKLGFEATADAAVFRHYSSEFGLVLVVVYVDDCLFAGAHESCLHFITALARDYEVKPTGELKHGCVGCVEFLGKEVKREGSLLIGLPATYWDGIETASGLTVKSQENPPDLSRHVDSETPELDTVGAEKYRTVLGKLAWYSLTLPLLQYYVSWLSCYQQRPTEASWTAMRLVLRYAKNFQGTFQAITSGTQWQGDEQQVHGITDASWAVRSVAGGVVLWRDTMVKSWSRRIATPYLSSAEAELFGIVECPKECLFVAICIQTFLEGLPPQEAWQESGVMKLVVWTDSESAKNISMMQGLLRRVRHLELRVMLVQHHTDSGRLVVSYVPGAVNPTDCLTKPSDRKHAQMLSELSGLQLPTAMRSLFASAAAVLESFQPMSAQNRRRVTEGLRRALSGMSLSIGASALSGHSSFLSSGLGGGSAPATVRRQVRFAPGV
ncbi:RE2, partial [Symbiodinium pilosum]